MTEIPSPCRDICKLDQSRLWCTGCGRSLDEIAGWLTASEAERQAIVDQLPERLRRLSD